MKYDAIVLGLGAVGSAAAYQLARRGARVLGIDRHAPPHDMGSSHGGTRITRLAIGEGAHYSPLAMRAHAIWREVERETGAGLLRTNGGLFISSDGKLSKTHVDGFFPNTVSAARKYNVPHELLDASEIRRRYPQFAVGDEEFGYFEPSAGFLRPELCIEAQLSLARRFGAEIHINERVLGFEPAPSGVRVSAESCSYDADKLIVAAGAWVPEFLERADASLFRVYRQVQLWFAPETDSGLFSPEQFPVFIWELRRQRQGLYGFPAVDGAKGGVKIATEAFESPTTPQDVRREVSREEIRETYDNLIAPFFPGLSPICVKASVCLYTVTPDFGFVIDTHPRSPHVMIASACSGHGFKHSPAIGEALAEWALLGRSVLDLGAFRLSRFAR